MPYNRKYRTTARGRRRKMARRSAATTIQRGWKNRAKRKRGSLVVRTVKANRKAIKKIKKDRQLKFVNDSVCSLRTNWCGQLLSYTQIDNYGMSQSSRNFAGPPIVYPSLPPSSYSPVVMQPIVVPQSGNIPAGGTVAYPSDDNSREGNDIIMSHLTLKVTGTGSFAASNSEAYDNAPMLQHINVLVVLDNNPGDENASINSAAPAYDALATPASLYAPTPDNTFVPSAENVPGEDFLRSLVQNTANPPGLTTGGWADRDLYDMSFWSKDHVNVKDPRFKVLKKEKLSFWQQPDATQFPNTYTALKSVQSKTITIKAPYRFHFNKNSDLIPSNQNILVFLSSDTPTKRSTSATAAPINWVEPPAVAVVSRFSFRDP